MTAGHDDDCIAPPPAVRPCGLCKGRGDVEDPASGGDFTCCQCQGTCIEERTK